MLGVPPHVMKRLGIEMRLTHTRSYPPPVFASWALEILVKSLFLFAAK
jgi:hypothetical protein